MSALLSKCSKLNKRRNPSWFIFGVGLCVLPPVPAHAARAADAGGRTPPEWTDCGDGTPAASSQEANRSAPEDDAPLSADDQATLRELESELNSLEDAATESGSTAGITVRGTPAQSASKSTAGLYSNIYNPALSLNGLFLGGYRHSPEESDEASDAVEEEGEEGEEFQSGVSVQEIEVQLISNVDP